MFTVVTVTGTHAFACWLPLHPAKTPESVDHVENLCGILLMIVLASLVISRSWRANFLFPGVMQKVPLHPDRAHPLSEHAGPPRGRARPTALGDAAAPVHTRPPTTLSFVSGFLPSFVFSSGSFFRILCRTATTGVCCLAFILKSDAAPWQQGEGFITLAWV